MNNHPIRRNNMFPVFKFDLNRRLIESNQASQTLLGKWGWAPGEAIPTSVLSQNPELFHCMLSQSPSDLTVSMDGFVIRFSIVPFPEAGYIGVYAYAMESNATLAKTTTQSPNQEIKVLATLNTTK